MLLRSIRSRLIGLVVASVVPFAALIGAGLWNQWRTGERAALQRAINEARLTLGAFAYPFTAVVGTGLKVRATDIQELREAVR